MAVLNPLVSLPDEIIFERIYIIREQKVMLDADLATLYGVETKQLKRAIKRNIERFPEDFMFELSKEEFEILRSQIGTSSWGGTRYPPFAFTEHGVAMLSGILNSQKAITVNIQIMRVFIKMRQIISNYKELLEKIEALEANDTEQNRHIENIYNLIRELMQPAQTERRPIGFRRGRE